LTPIGPDTVLAVFLLFCRIGGCLMLMPGFSSARIPMQVRLFLAVAVTLTLSPLLLPTLPSALLDPAPAKILPLIASELMVGALIGVMGRLFFAALQFMATATAMYIGYGNLPGIAVEDTEPVPALTALVTLTATLLLFITDQHWEVLRALMTSYTALPVTEPFGLEFSVAKLAEIASRSFVLALQITAPFLVYSLIINLMVGVVSKFTPQIPAYFISLPFMLVGGLIVLYFTFQELMNLFANGFGAWLATG
jgi:flagellar biosynthesis protein FliR